MWSIIGYHACWMRRRFRITEGGSQYLLRHPTVCLASWLFHVLVIRNTYNVGYRLLMLVLLDLIGDLNHIR